MSNLASTSRLRPAAGSTDPSLRVTLPEDTDGPNEKQPVQSETPSELGRTYTAGTNGTGNEGNALDAASHDESKSRSENTSATMLSPESPGALIPNTPPTTQSIQSSTTSQQLSQQISEVKPKPQATTPESTAEAEKTAKLKRMRRHVSTEIMTSEKSYVDSLRVIVTTWIPAFDAAFSDDALRRKVFTDFIALLLDLNSRFLAELQISIQNWDDEETLIGRSFITFAPYFRMYTNYVSNHGLATDELRKIEKSNAFVKMETNVMKDPTVKSLGLAAYLIMPIQRIPRYKLLLTELLRCTPAGHKDYKDIVHALELVEKVAIQVNESIRAQQAADVMRRLQDDLRIPNLVQPTRTFVRSGTLVKQCRNSDIEYEVFLFNDILVYASRGVRGLKARKPLVIDTSFHIAHATADVVRPTATDTAEQVAARSICILSSVKSIILKASTEAEKEEWFASISQCIRERAQQILTRAAAASTRNLLCSGGSSPLAMPSTPTYSSRPSIASPSMSGTSLGEIGPEPSFLRTSSTQSTEGATSLMTYLTMTTADGSEVSISAPGTSVETDTSDVKPLWESDSASTKCRVCDRSFSFFRRRHHCRKCGALVCGDCSSEKVKNERTCLRCVEHLKTTGSGESSRLSRNSTMSRLYASGPTLKLGSLASATTAATVTQTSASSAHGDRLARPSPAKSLASSVPEGEDGEVDDDADIHGERKEQPANQNVEPAQSDTKPSPTTSQPPSMVANAKEAKEHSDDDESYDYTNYDDVFDYSDDSDDEDGEEGGGEDVEDGTEIDFENPPNSDLDQATGNGLPAIKASVSLPPSHCISNEVLEASTTSRRGTTQLDPTRRRATSQLDKKTGGHMPPTLPPTIPQLEYPKMLSLFRIFPEHKAEKPLASCDLTTDISQAQRSLFATSLYHRIGAHGPKVCRVQAKYLPLHPFELELTQNRLVLILQSFGKGLALGVLSDLKTQNAATGYLPHAETPIFGASVNQTQDPLSSFAPCLHYGCIGLFRETFVTEEPTLTQKLHSELKELAMASSQPIVLNMTSSAYTKPASLSGSDLRWNGAAIAINMEDDVKMSSDDVAGTLVTNSVEVIPLKYQNGDVVVLFELTHGDDKYLGYNLSRANTLATTFETHDANNSNLTSVCFGWVNLHQLHLIEGDDDDTSLSKPPTIPHAYYHPPNQVTLLEEEFSDMMSHWQNETIDNDEEDDEVSSPTGEGLQGTQSNPACVLPGCNCVRYSAHISNAAICNACRHGERCHVEIENNNH